MHFYCSVHPIGYRFWWQGLLDYFGRCLFLGQQALSYLTLPNTPPLSLPYTASSLLKLGWNDPGPKRPIPKIGRNDPGRDDPGPKRPGFAGMLVLPFRPWYNNMHDMSLLSLLRFLRNSYFRCSGMPVVPSVSKLQFPVTNLAARFWTFSSSFWRPTPEGSQTEPLYSRTGHCLSFFWLGLPIEVSRICLNVTDQVTYIQIVLLPNVILNFSSNFDLSFLLPIFFVLAWVLFLLQMFFLISEVIQGTEETSFGWDVFICRILNKRSDQVKVLLYRANIWITIGILFLCKFNCIFPHRFIITFLI